MNKRFTEVRCPKCGCVMQIPTTEHHVSGVCIAENSGLGTVYLTPKGEQSSALLSAPSASSSPCSTGWSASHNPSASSSKAAERLAALEKRGFNTSGYSALINPSGEGIVVKWDNNIPTIVTDSELDIIEKSILESGYVKNTRLWRRFVMAQMFKMLESKRGYTDYLNRLGYKYMIKMLVEEISTIAVLERKDAECFAERVQFFNRETVTSILWWYYTTVEKMTKEAKVRHCKGKPYKHLFGQNYFITDINSKLLAPIKSKINEIERCKSYDEIAKKLKSFRFVRLQWRTDLCPTFKDSYKGAGAYYTAKNLILFHGCCVHADNGRILSRDESFEVLKAKAHEYCGSKSVCKDGWKLFGWMKKLINDNNFDFKSRMNEIYGNK